MLTELLVYVCFFLLGVIGAFFLHSKNARPRGFPPGPFILPLVGSLPFMKGDPFGKIKEWRQKYGDVFGFQIGVYRAVFICKYELLNDALRDNAFLGRPELMHFMHVMDGKKRGVTFNDGDDWKEQRQFMFTNLKELGFGQKSMERMIQGDAAEFVDYLNKEVVPLGQPVSPRAMFGVLVLRSLWNMVTSEDCPMAGARIHQVAERFHAAIAGTKFGGATFFLPWFLKLAPNLSNWNLFKKGLDATKQFLRDVVEEHKESYKPGHVRDYIDVYLNQIETCTDPTSSFYQLKGNDSLRMSLYHIFGAGTETTNNVLNFALLCLAMNPGAQKKLHQEIDAVVGSTRLPSLSDKKEMRYTCAVILEALRLGSVVPFGLPYKTLQDVKFQGYLIPKNTLVFADFYGINYDTEIWGADADSFRPERYMTSTLPIPTTAFSLGKRACPGRLLAEMNLFLFITTIYQKFSVELVPGADVIQLSRAMVNATGVTRNPPPFKVFFKPRVIR